MKKQIRSNSAKTRSCRSAAPAAFAASLALIAGGCAKTAATASTSDPVTVNGTFSSAKTSTGRYALPASTRLVSSEDRFRSLIGGNFDTSASVAFNTYSLHCVTADVPPIESDGTINADGTFSMDIAGGLNKALTCNVLDSAGATVAQVLLNDSAKKDMNGNSQVNGTPAFSGTTSLGSLVLDLTTGDVNVPAAQVAGTLLSGDTALGGVAAFDPTGTWKISDVDFTLPKGVKGTCTSAQQQNNTCNGPPANAMLYLNRLTGKNVSDASTVYGLQVWQDESGTNPKAAMDACGGMTGLAASDATKAGVDLSSYGAKNGAFTLSTSITDPVTSTTATVTEGFKLTTAKAQFDMMACVPKAIIQSGVTYNTYVCGPDTAGNSSPGGRYSASLGGGCVDAKGATVSNMDWSQVSWTGGTCTQKTPTLTGFYKSACTATYKGATITCTNENGEFTSAALATAAPSSGGGNPPFFKFAGMTPLMTAGQFCSAVSDSLMQVRCYADYYQQKIKSIAGACLPRVDTDWSSTDPTVFAKADFKPQTLVFMEKLTYTGAKTASMLTEQNQYRGVSVRDSSGGTQWVNCGAVEKGGLFLTKVSDTQLLATYVSSTSTTSVDKDACVGASWNGAKEKFFFYLNKQ